MKKICMILAFFLLLTACGYHLKQAVELNPAYDQTYLKLAVSSPLYKHLNNELSSQGINLTGSFETSTAQIDIKTDRLTKVIQSIGANNRVQEYRLDYTVIFSVTFGDEKVIEMKQLDHSRDYAFDIDQITGAQQEERILRDQLYQDMAAKLVRTIAR